MPVVTATATRDLPFSREQVFDVAADIERYPDFLPWWISARIASRVGQTWQVQQVLGLGPMRVPFTSTAIVWRPERIDVASTDKPFRRYQLCLQFESPSPAVCRLHVESLIEFESVLMQSLADRLVPRSLDGVISAFVRRTGSLHRPAGN